MNSLLCNICMYLYNVQYYIKSSYVVLFVSKRIIFFKFIYQIMHGTCLGQNVIFKSTSEQYAMCSLYLCLSYDTYARTLKFVLFNLFQIITKRYCLHWIAFDRSFRKVNYEQIQRACLRNGGKTFSYSFIKSLHKLIN